MGWYCNIILECIIIYFSDKYDENSRKTIVIVEILEKHVFSLAFQIYSESFDNFNGNLNGCCNS